MKSVTIAAAGLLLSAVQAVPMEKRQAKDAKGGSGIGDLLASMNLKEIQPYRVELMKPMMSREGGKRVRITYGPFDILGAEEAKKAVVPFRMDPGATTFNHIAKGFPVNVTVLMTNTSLVLENGKQAAVEEGIYNHHTVFFDRSKESPVYFDCPAKPAEERAKIPKKVPFTIFAGTSEDSSRSVYSSIDGKFNSGFYMPNTDNLMFMGEVINYKNTTQKVFAITDVEYVDGKPKDMLDAWSTVLSVNMCGPTGEDGRPKDLDIAPGQKKAILLSDPIIVTTDGYFLYSKGHLHDGGDTIILKINDKVVCESKAVYGGAGQEWRENGKVWATLSSMGECGDPVRVQKGDKIAIEARYDFDAHPARKHAGGVMGEAEVMGIFGTTFAADKPL